MQKNATCSGRCWHPHHRSLSHRVLLDCCSLQHTRSISQPKASSWFAVGGFFIQRCPSSTLERGTQMSFPASVVRVRWWMMPPANPLRDSVRLASICHESAKLAPCLKESNDNQKLCIAVGIHESLVLIFALWKLHKHIEKRCDDMCPLTRDNVEYQLTEFGNEIREFEDYEERVDLLHSYVRRIRRGLILNGCFTQHEVPDLQTIVAYDMLGKLNAGNFLARRRLEDLQTTEVQYWGHQVMLKVARDGATPLEGPLKRMFQIGNREISIREQHITEQANQMCGRLEQS